MTAPKPRYRLSIRQIHRVLAPLMLLPIVLTAITGTGYQLLDLIGKEHRGHWLMELHVGHFGRLNLAAIYPFLNALGLIVLAVTGISMWLNLRRTKQRSV